MNGSPVQYLIGSVPSRVKLVVSELEGPLARKAGERVAHELPSQGLVQLHKLSVP